MTGSSREAALRRTLLLGVILAVAPVFSLHAVEDPDVFWHLRAGAWIREHGAVPTTDPFSTWGEGRPWVAYSWLFEVALDALHRALGWPGVVLGTAVACLGLAALLLRLVSRLEPRFGRATLLAGLGVVGLLRLAAPRPWLFTIAAFLLELDLLWQVRRTRRLGAALALPLLFAVWANVHIQFVYGLAALACLALEAFLERLFPDALDTHPRGPLQPEPLVLLLGASALATLANPYGWGVWRVVLEYARFTGAFASVHELRALEFRQVPDWAVLASVLAGAFALGWRRTRRPFPYLLLAASAAAAFRAGRDSWLAAVVGVAVAADSEIPADSGGRADAGAGVGPETAPDPAETFRPGKASRAAIALGLAATLALVARARGLDGPGLDRALAREWPEEACRFVEERGLEGPLENPFDWGGYLIWRLPRCKVSMDGRTNLHGDERLARSEETWAGRGDWASDPDLAGARLVLAPAGGALAGLLRGDARFEVAHVDSVAVVFRAR